MAAPVPLVLMVLDGWGHREETDYNAVACGRTPVLDRLSAEYPSTLIGTSGLDVGLPPGQMGNSEVGHQNLGAGRIVYQDLTRISRAVEDGSFFQNPALTMAVERAREAGGALHLLGLVSDGGVHSHLDHLEALLELARRRGLQRVWVHAVLDGRDTPPTSGLGYIRRLQDAMGERGVGGVATVMGRYYAMDRDRRWERVAAAYRAMVEGAAAAPSAEAAVEEAYARGETDEFVQPRSVSASGRPVVVAPGDAVIFFNFRADRAREITRAFTDPDFSDFPRRHVPLSAFVCMTEYDETFGLPVAFPPVALANIFPEVISRAGLPQLRIAETEKYAHVTFFFNGGDETTFPGEERILIPSPRDVATYDQKPEMSAYQVTDEVLRRIASGRYRVIVLNFANGDMVGHTGVFEAAVRAVEAVDECIGRIHRAVAERGGVLLITSDHGNCEMMRDPVTGEPFTAHTANPVPLLLTVHGARLRSGGILADVAPTLLQILGLPRPPEMTGRSLLEAP